VAAAGSVLALALVRGRRLHDFIVTSAPDQASERSADLAAV
jgi:hypothetical protein